MRIAVPLEERTDGEPHYPAAVVTLRVRSRFGDYVSLPFKIDTGADRSAIPIVQAQRAGIHFSRSFPGALLAPSGNSGG
jgi:hypothetical protein